MKRIEIFFVFFGLAIVLASLTIPLWWERAQPHLFALPGRISNMISDVSNFIRYILDAIKSNI